MTIAEYKEIRSAGKRLADRILEWKFPEKKVLVVAARLFGFWDRGVIVFGSEDESTVLMDFLLYEPVSKGKGLLESFYDSNEIVEGLEEEILEAKMDHFSSLFEIESIDRNACIVKLSDLLDPSYTTYAMMDLGLSQTGIPGVILYGRMIPIRDVHISSGIQFVFEPQFKQRIVHELSIIKFKSKGKAQSREMYLNAFMKSKQYGRIPDGMNVT